MKEQNSETLERGKPAFHGYAPLDPEQPSKFRPPLTIAISRETGSRGREIVKRTAELLGWQHFEQETLEYLTQSPGFHTDLPEQISDTVDQWIGARINELFEANTLSVDAELLPLFRVVLEIGALGNSVILGRGAGCVLPDDAKLHVRLISPLKDRIAYISQLERLSLADAAKYVRERDGAREEFVTQQFGFSPSDSHQYDLVLNVAAFGVESSSAIIAAAVKEKEAFLLDKQRESRQ